MTPPLVSHRTDFPPPFIWFYTVIFTCTSPAIATIATIAVCVIAITAITTTTSTVIIIRSYICKKIT